MSALWKVEVTKTKKNDNQRFNREYGLSREVERLVSRQNSVEEVVEGK
jgi:hypothetical protein